MKKVYIIPATIVLLAIAFLLYELFNQKSPCEKVFQQTTVQLTSSLKVLQQTGSISIGEQKIQDLTEAAQVVALNLKTCCIMNMSHQITSEQFLKCQQVGDQYKQQVDDLSKNVDKAGQAKKTGDISTMNQTLLAIDSQLDNLHQTVQQIADISKPSPIDNSTEGRINLINVKFGGQILVAPADYWAKSIDSSEEGFTITCEDKDCEGVYGFKDGRSATFDMFCMLIPATRLNVKKFTLYYGNDSPTGRFDSIGSFQTQNVLIFAQPYQQFKFPAIDAKYFKIRIISYWGNSEGEAYEFQLWGKLK